MQLSAQTIKNLCILERPMISPFSEAKLVVNGRSKGLGPATYDICIAEDLTLGINPALVMQQAILEGWFDTNERELLKSALRANPPQGAIAHSVEKLVIPTDISAEVMDKSTHARLLVGMFNTYIDPGFEGDLVLELVNSGDTPLVLKKGDPVAQLKFTWLDSPTDRPYAGRYQHQQGSQAALFFPENPNGTQETEDEILRRLRDTPEGLA